METQKLCDDLEVVAGDVYAYGFNVALLISHTTINCFRHGGEFSVSHCKDVIKNWANIPMITKMVIKGLASNFDEREFAHREDCKLWKEIFKLKN